MMPPVMDPALASLLAERFRADPEGLAEAMRPSEGRAQQILAVAASAAIVAVWLIGAALA